MERRKWYERPTWRGIAIALGSIVVGVAVKEPIVVEAGVFTGALEVGFALNRFAGPSVKPQEHESAKLLGEIETYLRAEQPEDYFCSQYLTEHRSKLNQVLGVVALGSLAIAGIHAGLDACRQLVDGWQSIAYHLHQ